MPEAQAAPPGQSDLPLALGEVQLEGGFPELASANAAFVDQLAHRQLTLGALFDAARTLEQSYAARGYILVRIVVPPQKLDRDQPVRVMVVDGFIEAIDLDHVPQPIREAVAKRLRPLVGQRRITEQEIERRLLLAGDLAGLSLRSALVRGHEMGGARLLVEGELNRFSGSVGIDNRLPSSLGAWQWNAGVVANNLLGIGDRFYLTSDSQTDMTRYGFPTSSFGLIGGGIDLPIGTDGLLLGIDALHSRVQPTPTAGAPATIGDFTRTQLHLSLPAIRTRIQTLQLTGTFSAIDQSLYAPDFGLLLNHDRYDALRLGLDWQRLLTGAQVALNLTLSQGIDGRSATDTVPLSRAGASSHFTTLDAQARIDVGLGSGTQLALVTRGQEAFGKPQLLSEQFALDTPDGVSAFPAGSFSVDSGVTLRGELSHWISSPSPGVSLQPYLFAAQGWGWLERASAVEQSYRTVHSAGMGARFGFLGIGRGATLGLELGWTGGKGLANGARATLTSSVKF